ncbi:MAG: DNA polymerase III subunit beta [Spirochaetota bacterium]
MKFICNKDEFLKNAKYAKGAVSSKQAMQILSNFLITAKDNIISISSTDLELSVITTFSGEVEVPGSITVHATKITDIIDTYPSTDLYFNLDLRNWLTITSTDSNIKTKHRIQGLPAEDYPEVRHFIEENSFKIDRTLLKTMIKKTIHATAKEEQRPHLKGIFFENKEDDNKLILVATDGKRLTKIESEVESLKDVKPFEIIVPRKVLDELLNVLSEEGDCTVSVMENKLYFKVADVEIATNLIEGQFPSYDKVIPESFDHNITVETEILYDALKRTSGMLDKNNVQIKLDISKDGLTIIGNNPEYGESRDEINIEYDGEAKILGFNYNFLLDALKEIEDKELKIEMSTQALPISIRGSNTYNYINIVMPMRLENE